MTPAEDGRQSVTVYDGITYADREASELKLDLYLPEAENPPLVVYVHGGGWFSETRDNVPEPRRYAAEWDCAIASVSYRLSELPDDLPAELAGQVDPDNPTPRGVFPDHFVDVKAAIRWLRAHSDEYGYDASRVAAWGSSAGGHLALLAGALPEVTDLAGEAYPESALEPTVAPGESGAVQAVVDWYGFADFTLATEEPAVVESMLIGGPVSDNEAEFVAASPVTHVTGDMPPTLVMHGREDDVVSVEHSRVLVDALEEHGVDAVSYELRHLNHVWSHGGLEDIESERVAMDLLAADPTPAQSVRQTTHVPEGGTVDPLLADVPPAGPAAIGQFFHRTIGSSGGDS
ncbi:MAG: alpha/beta hydrolase [Haloarculaceae archaeon]